MLVREGAAQIGKFSSDLYRRDRQLNSLPLLLMNATYSVQKLGFSWGSVNFE